MARDLSNLFDSVQDVPPDASSSTAPVPSSGFSGKSGVGGVGVEASTLTASTASSTMFSTSTEAVLTRVLYYSTSEENPICMGLIGERDLKKFCCSTNCGVGKHEISKFQSKAGLFIRVPKKVDQAFTNPFLPDQNLEAPLLELFLESEKTAKEWSAIFSQILAAGIKFSADAWTALQIVRNKAKANRTPRKTATIKNELYDKLFTATSTSISNVMKKNNTGMEFEDPTGKIVIEKNSDFFVDDTATGVTQNKVEDGRTALEHLQSDEQKHAFLLFASGHLLALFKCFFYYFAFKLVGTKFVHTRNEELPGKLFLQSKYGGKQEEIRRLQPDEAHKTLGCHISVDMSQEKQLEIVRDIILNWTRRINSSPLSTSDRMYAYKSILEKKLLFILPTCSFNYEQCRGLDKLLSKTLLNIHGIQRNCNRNVLYTSKEMGGLHIYTMYYLQGVSKIQFLFRHYRSNDTTGKLMKISMRYTQLETGLSKPYYSYNYYKAHFLATITWHTNIWQYSSESHVRLRESDPWIYKPPRQNDFHLMDMC